MPRLDQVLVTQGLADSRAHAQRLIGDGQMDVWLAQLNELGQQYSEQPEKIALLQAVYEYGQGLADALNDDE